MEWMVTAMILVACCFTSLYSPMVHNGTLYVGGWATVDDPAVYLDAVAAGTDPATIVGPDKLYRIEQNGTVALVLARVGAHINDPSVITPPSTDGIDRSGWQFLYYTALPNIYAAQEFWTEHQVGFASSVDGGATWWDHGPILGPGLSLDSLGAWSPSALVVGNEIHVYYHDGFGYVWRSRLAANGWQQLDSPEFIGMLASNVDVRIDGTELVMLSNELDLTGIDRRSSPDGLAWSDPVRLIEGHEAWLPAPYGERLSADTEAVWFGYAPAFASESIHRWEFVRQFLE